MSPRGNACAPHSDSSVTFSYMIRNSNQQSVTPWKFSISHFMALSCCWLPVTMRTVLYDVKTEKRAWSDSDVIFLHPDRHGNMTEKGLGRIAKMCHLIIRMNNPGEG